MKAKDSFGNWLRQRRKALDLTQIDLADQVGCSVVTVRKIEADERRPSKQITERLADVLAISLEERSAFVAFARHTQAAPSDASLPSVAVIGKHNLPSQPTPFIGRADELAEVAQRLNDPTCRLLTLVGAGGSGKTRLALEAAHDQIANFADGVYFVVLTPVAVPNLVAAAIAGALKLTFYDPADPAASIVGYLRAKALLLLLDNFEHLLEATGLLTDILAAAPQVKMLVTSREALNLQEEWVRRVDGLSFPTALTLNPSPQGRGTGSDLPSPLGEGPGVRAALESYSAIRLFIERARQVRANFSLADEWDNVLRICQLVQGMPLAIELAAAWLKTLPCARIADEIQRNLDFLASPLRNVPERHRSMRAVFDHSWKLLTIEEQSIFRTLAVFRGGFEHEAAERIANASLQTLTALVDKSLLQCTTAGRYDLHELLRQYAEQQLEAAGESANARAAHSAYYMDFVAQRDADVKGRRQAPALNEIRTDFENIRAAWQWAQDHRRYDAISRAVNCLLNFAEMRSSLPDVLGILQQTSSAFAPAEGTAPHPVWEQMLVRCEWANWRLVSRVDHELVETILGHAHERGDREEVAWCVWMLTDHARLGPDRARQVILAEESLALRRALGDEFYIAHALNGLSTTYDHAGQRARALDCARECVTIRRRLGEMHGLAWILSNLGRQLLFQGSLSEAETYYDQAITVQEAYGKSQLYVQLMTIKAVLAFWRGEFEAAARLVAVALDFARDQDFAGGRSYGLAVLSFVQSMAANYAQSRELCQSTGPIDPFVKIWVDWGQALANCGLGDDQAAEQALQATLRSASYNSRWPIFQRLCLPLAGILAARSGDLQRAVELLGLTSTAPHALIGWLEKWPLMTNLKSELQAELDVEAYESAWGRGKTLALDSVVAELLGNPQSA
ncbi:MAG: helix-turn-helix domain-containing protein [Aggregatilineales bacterium]